MRLLLQMICGLEVGTAHSIQLCVHCTAHRLAVRLRGGLWRWGELRLLVMLRVHVLLRLLWLVLLVLLVRIQILLILTLLLLVLILLLLLLVMRLAALPIVIIGVMCIGLIGIGGRWICIDRVIAHQVMGRDRRGL